jgi:hypothetical protein
MLLPWLPSVVLGLGFLFYQSRLENSARRPWRAKLNGMFVKAPDV